jgi:hypothetical protein
VILTAGVLEPLDEAQTKRVEADGTLRKPFEASALLAAVKPLAEAAEKDRSGGASRKPDSAATGPADSAHVAPFIAVVDSEQVRAAVTVALDAAMGTMVEEITRRVLHTLNKKKPDARTLASMTGQQPAPALHIPSPAPVPAMSPAVAPPPPAAAAAPAVQPRPAVPPPAMPRIEAVRRVSPLRLRSGSILGLDISRPEPEAPADNPEHNQETPPPEN